MKKIFNILILFLLNPCPLTLSSQEIVTGIQGNAVAEEYYLKIPFSKKASIPADTIELPFIDDFSDSNVEPKRKLWSDRYAFINSTYAIYPPTVGVATLDALNYNGSQYPGAGTESYKADYLTTQPINLKYSASENIYLSFYYQPGGLAEPPEKSDSLILDFFSADSLTWHKIWAATGPEPDSLYKVKEFNRVMIKIDDPVFLKKGFRFRFRNYASQFANTDNADKRANVDLWHIDYVKLDRNRQSSDTILRDVAFAEPVKNILKEYTSIPWSHFESAYVTQRAPFIEVLIKNLDSIPRNIGTLLEIRDLLNNRPIYKIPAFNNSILSGDSILYKYTYNYPFFEINKADSGSFEIKTILQTDSFDYKLNDTLRHIQKFYDYYALDDGTAEASYGMRGSGTKDASSALKFNSFAGDSLRAVDIYFAQVVDSLNLGYYFYLNVWDDKNGKPGNTLVNQIGMRPEYTDRLNKFWRYKLESPVFIQGAFYIGFTQTVEKLLNVGLDLNRPNQSKIFNNINNGIWEATTKLPGTPMMRPVFQMNVVLGNNFPEITQIYAWPNPADNFITISIDESDQQIFQNSIQLIDISGRIIRTINPEDESIINTGHLQNGMYFLRMTDPASKKSNTKKIIIRH